MVVCTVTDRRRLAFASRGKGGWEFLYPVFNPGIKDHFSIYEHEPLSRVTNGLRIATDRNDGLRRVQDEAR